MIYVHFYNTGPDKFIMVDDLNAVPGSGPALNARINSGQDLSTGPLTTDGDGYGAIRWETREADSGRQEGGDESQLQQGRQITI